MTAVPLTVYIDGVRHVIGEAEVEGDLANGFYGRVTLNDSLHAEALRGTGAHLPLGLDEASLVLPLKKATDPSEDLVPKFVAPKDCLDG